MKTIGKKPSLARVAMILSLVLCLLICVPFSACSPNRGKTDGVQVELGASTLFSRNELMSAVDCVKKEFVAFEDCELIRIWYDEERSNFIKESYMTHGRGKILRVTRENVIILFSDFYVGPSAAGSFNLNSTYKNWNWILVREAANSPWRLDDYGY